MNLFPEEFSDIGRASALGGLGAASSSRPDIRELFEATYKRALDYNIPGEQERVQEISNALYGDVGANLDARDWGAIMSSSNPLQASQDALAKMYSDPGYMAKNLEHGIKQGYSIQAVDITYKQMEDRVGSSYTDTYLQTPTAQQVIKSVREDVIKAFLNTPGANPEPDEDAISYYIYKGVDQLKIDVDAVRASNPALAAKIDARRKALKLPPFDGGTTVTPAPHVLTEPDLVPIYSKEYPYPIIDHDAIGFLWQESPFKMTKFNLKKGDQIPINWSEDFKLTTPIEPPTLVIDCAKGYRLVNGECVPIGPPVEPPRPTPAAAGTGTLLLAAVAAYLLGS